MDTESSDDEHECALRRKPQVDVPQTGRDEAMPVSQPRLSSRTFRDRGIRSASSVPIRPPPPPRPDKYGRLPMTRCSKKTELPESYGEDEKKLNQFLALHGMLSLDATSKASMQLAIDLLPMTEISMKTLPVVGKLHDDRFLRPARREERACCLGNHCIGRFLAIFRYGEDTEYAITIREFLLPSEERVFLESGTLPVTTGKCLLCSRYFVTYAYRLARADVHYNEKSEIPIFAYTNVVCSISGENLVQSSCLVSDLGDGYPSKALLGVDAEFSRSEAARAEMGALLVRPYVGFNSMDYTYIKDGDGNVEITQNFHSAGRGEGNPRLAQN
jgi:hypothetical protein